MPDFNQETPPATVTNPGGAPKGAEYPKHLYKYGEGKNSLVVAWEDDKPIHNQTVVVANPTDEAKKVGEGYGPEPVLKAPKK